VLHEEPGTKVKRIEVAPGQRLSYQTHASRSEHWYVVAGSGVARVAGVEFPVAVGHAIMVEVGDAHRIANTGDEPLVFIEVQRGSYLGEDDIVRIEDDFGRAS
jgi:mannose-6-phosphate isomerase